jgi:hypothetical protein
MVNPRRLWFYEVAFFYRLKFYTKLRQAVENVIAKNATNEIRICSFAKEGN